MLFEDAKIYHNKQFFEGKNKYSKEYIFPYNFLYDGEEFIETLMPIDKLILQETDNKRVNKYKKILEKRSMGHSWLSIGKKLKDGSIVRYWHQQLYVLDGNHRTKAQIDLGRTEIKVMMPKSHYDLYFEVTNG